MFGGTTGHSNACMLKACETYLFPSTVFVQQVHCHDVGRHANVRAHMGYDLDVALAHAQCECDLEVCHLMQHLVSLQ